jgi:hypothetical protein
MGLLLHDCCSRQNTGAQRYIADMQFYEITSTQFAVNRKVEQSEISNSLGKLSPNTNGPDHL